MDSRSNQQFKCNTTCILNVSLLVFEILIILPKCVFLTLVAIIKYIFPTPQKPIKGEIVVVTGAGHGIGKELALQYAALDAVVVCIDMNANTNDNTVEEIKRMGKNVFGYICNVRNLTEVKKTFEKIQKEVGDISILVNNAGVLKVDSFLKVTEEDVKKTFETNVFSHIWTLQVVLPIMIKNNHGHIVAIASGFSRVGVHHFATYCSSKSAVRGLMQSVESELRLKQNNQIKFTTVLPSIVNTGFYDDYSLRYPFLLRPVPTPKLAESVIYAQRRNIEDVSVPNYQNLILSFINFLPTSVVQLLIDKMELLVDVSNTEIDKIEKY